MFVGWMSAGKVHEKFIQANLLSGPSPDLEREISQLRIQYRDAHPETPSDRIWNKPISI